MWYFVRNFYEGFPHVGVRDHFPIYGTRIPSRALVIDMARAIGAGIPASSDVIDVCVSKHQSTLLGGDEDSSCTAGLQARGYRPVCR